MSLLSRICISGTGRQIRYRYISKRLYLAYFSSLAEVANTNFENLKSPNINGKNERSRIDNKSYEHFSKKKRIFINAVNEGPGLKEFIANSSELPDSHKVVQNDFVPYLTNADIHGRNRKVYFEVYGCQMNVNDTEIIWSILKDVGYEKTDSIYEADVILMVTCAIREGAENKVWNKLKRFRTLKNIRMKHLAGPPMKIGILGCMAERLKHQLVEKEKAVDVVAGPDSYKDLPRLLALTDNDQTAVNVLLSFDETYADIVPVRLNQDSVTAFVSIMRGCDNMCTYCIVPFTRGRERSRPIESILEEVNNLSQQGVKEVTLLGQNVNSYRDTTSEDYYGGMPAESETHLAKGFRTVYKKKKGGLRFSDLLDHVSKVNPEMRIRFTSPHPKDFPDEVLELIRDRKNICCNLHMPAQSGNTAVLERMRRGYSREAYLDLIAHVKEMIPNVALSSDFICGFCGETEAEFEDTLSLMAQVKYNMAFLFAYSMREKTTAHRRFVDDVPPDVKQQRVHKMNQLFRKEAEELNKAQIGKEQLILVEGRSKRSDQDLAGRNDGNTKVIIPAGEIPDAQSSQILREVKPGDYIAVKITSANSQVLKGVPLYHSTLSSYKSSDC